MSEQQMGTHTLQSHGCKLTRVHLHDWVTLLFLVIIYVVLNFIEPFHRFISQAMMTDSSYPFKDDTVPFWAVPIYAVLLPLVVFGVYYCYRRDVYDLHHATLGLMYTIVITGVITDAIKDAVGRPRPDFFWRCFPDGNGVYDMVTGDVICHGDSKVIKDGYKSFPSGHTSWSFAGLSFLSWYMAGKLGVFDRRGHISRICVILLPLLMAALVGISRVDDYRHHWTDVFAGALLGLTVSALCYLQFFPYPNKENGWAPHDFFEMGGGHRSSATSGLSSIRLERPETAFVGLRNGGSHSESSSPSMSPV